MHRGSVVGLMKKKKHRLLSKTTCSIPTIAAHVDFRSTSDLLEHNSLAFTAEQLVSTRQAAVYSKSCPGRHRRCREGGPTHETTEPPLWTQPDSEL